MKLSNYDSTEQSIDRVFHTASGFGLVQDMRQVRGTGNRHKAGDDAAEHSELWKFCIRFCGILAPMGVKRAACSLVCNTQFSMQPSVAQVYKTTPLSRLTARLLAAEV